MEAVQLDREGLPVSRQVYAPVIRYMHDNNTQRPWLRFSARGLVGSRLLSPISNRSQGRCTLSVLNPETDFTMNMTPAQTPNTGRGFRQPTRPRPFDFSLEDNFLNMTHSPSYQPSIMQELRQELQSLKQEVAGLREQVQSNGTDSVPKSKKKLPPNLSVSSTVCILVFF